MNEISMLLAGSFNAALKAGSAARRTVEGVGVSTSSSTATGPGPQKQETRGRPPVPPTIDPENHRGVRLFENRQIGTAGNFSGKRRGGLA